MSAVVYHVPMVGLLVWAAVGDVRTRRVPNWITFSLVLSGLVLGMVSWGSISATQAWLGFATGLLLPIPLYALGALGAGDVKLLCGVGAWIGPVPVLVVCAGAALIGMILALAKSIQQGRMAEVCRDSMSIFVGVLGGGAGQAASVTSVSAPHLRQRTLPFAVAVAMATVAVLIARSATTWR